MKNFSWKMVLIFGLLIASIICLFPTLDMYINSKVEPTLWPNRQIVLGLDLQGGMHLVLEVDTQKAVEGNVERIAQEIKDRLKKNRIRNVVVDRVQGTKISVRVQKEENVEKVKALFEDEFEYLEATESTDNGMFGYTIELPQREADEIAELAVDQALEKIRNRIDQFGVSEPDIRRQGQNRILLQLPGISDPQRAKDLIGRTAQLEFKLVDNDGSVQAAIDGNVPPGRQLLYQVDVDPETGNRTKRPYLLKKRTLLTGDNLTDARVQIDSQYNNPYVSIEFDKKGARVFE